MVNEGQYDPMEKAKSCSVLHIFDGSPTAYRWLLDQEEFLIDLGTIASDQFFTESSNASEYLEAVLARGSHENDPSGFDLSGDGLPLAHIAVFAFKWMADNSDFPRRIKVLFDAGFDFDRPRMDNYIGYDGGTMLTYLFYLVSRYLDLDKFKFNKDKIDRQTFPKTLFESSRHIVAYDRLEDTSAIKYRSRTSRSLWKTWYPGEELSLLEVVQRHLDAWMEIILEAGPDTVDYGRREDQLHPKGIVNFRLGEARINFEYGDHVSGCRIHATEIWISDWGSDEDEDEDESTSAEASAIPGGWDFEDE